MPAKKKIPKYRLNRTTGRACVEIGGRVHWLGAYDSPESRQRYDRLIAEWLANGRQVPQPTQQASQDLTIMEVADRFWTHAQAFYRKPDGTPASEVENFRSALRPLKALYGFTPAKKFGPNAMKAVRQKMIDYGWCRSNINRQVARLRQVFKWAASQEYIPPTVFQSMATLSGLRKGKTEAREAEKVRLVGDLHVEAVRAFVAPQVWAMIELQTLTGMRPTEVCIMRGCDIDTSGNVWVYRPQFHKTEHHGHGREVYLGPRARAIVEQYLKPDLQAYLFSPKDAEAWRYSQAATHRRPDQKPKPRTSERTLRDHYDADSYRRGIAPACVKADAEARKQRRETVAKQGIELTPEQDLRIVPSWHPHQLRHNAATRLRKDFGIEVARLILGHRSAAVTLVYAEADAEKAKPVMAQVG